MYFEDECGDQESRVDDGDEVASHSVCLRLSLVSVRACRLGYSETVFKHLKADNLTISYGKHDGKISRDLSL